MTASFMQGINFDSSNGLFISLSAMFLTYLSKELPKCFDEITGKQDGR
jgi:hypothetical protein